MDRQREGFMRPSVILTEFNTEAERALNRNLIRYLQTNASMHGLIQRKREKKLIMFVPSKVTTPRLGPGRDK